MIHVSEDLDALLPPSHVDVRDARDPVPRTLASSGLDEAAVLGTGKAKTKTTQRRFFGKKGNEERTHTMPSLGTSSLTFSRSKIPRPDRR